jgi:hypothetical protein
LVKFEIYAQKLDYVNQGVLEDFIRKKIKTSLLQYGDKNSVKNIFCYSKIKLGSGEEAGAGRREKISLLCTLLSAPLPPLKRIR